MTSHDEETCPTTDPYFSIRNKSELLTGLIQTQLERILRLIDLEVDGVSVEADYFALGDPIPVKTCTHYPPDGKPIRYEAIESYTYTEGRLRIIKRDLERILGLGHFIQGNRILNVNGFRLKDLQQWSNYPCNGMFENVGSISSYCNCDCEFCFEKGTKGLGILLDRCQLSLRELNTRIECYSPERKTGLLPSARFSLESFTNPKCVEILERIHEISPGEVKSITTNGSFLTEDNIVRLSRLHPIDIVVSMNSGSPGMRKLSMRDRRPGGDETAFAALPLLRKHDIPFLASYVPWPTKPLSDLEDLVRYVDKCDGLFVRICLPSWTRAAYGEAPFDTRTYWTEIGERVKRLRSEVETPIIMLPNMYELLTMLPVVQGTIKHSPAAETGIRFGDLIVAIDGESVFTRPEVTNWLSSRFETHNGPTIVTVMRGSERIEIMIPDIKHRKDLRYPYRCLTVSGANRRLGCTFGMLLADGIQLSNLVKLKEIVEEYTGKRVLFYVSELAEHHFLEGMSMLGEFARFTECCDFHIEKLVPRYWGGNVTVGDLWTVQDLIEQTRSWIEHHGVRPDVVISPWTFLTPAGTDLLGNCPNDFERALDIEYRPLPCSQISL